MYQHTTIYKTGQLLLPEKVDSHFIADLLHVGQLKLDYFGIEIDNHNETPEEESLLELHFDTDQKIDYSMQESEIKHLLSELLTNRRAEIRTEDNDISVYL
ncbi:hypothetical protein DBB36_00680 [Flavobacterium sp. WLB]|uniref:hypothetical protein n=1 Tax=unclassified Flavobacterium TaxID=196869 RepID=UPI0006AB8024|nr:MULTISPECIES: hypothetical protein [unclassified Flavobacterium]KOP38845.1 hypothetical protein AKO67_07395 [Flavobacterium sp. VMW]OWU92791.1 hypothetical protein APR43_01660 [Flavobacterium sp. NLM]PUU71907.1 hypothetical protein DBB36_00680 [Flavobacterium sp. WLB]